MINSELEATKRLLAKLLEAEEYQDYPSLTDFYFPGNLPLTMTPAGVRQMVFKDLEERFRNNLEKE